MAFHYDSDPTGRLALKYASKNHEKLRKFTRQESNDAFIQFSVRNVVNLKNPEEQFDAIVKRLGTFAQSDRFSDADVSDFCAKLEEATNGRCTRDNLYGHYLYSKNYYRRGGPNGADNFITPAISIATV